MAPTAGGTSVPTAKATPADSNTNQTPAAPTTQKPAAQLEEDDEFEDFPVEGQSSVDDVMRRAHLRLMRTDELMTYML